MSIKVRWPGRGVHVRGFADGPRWTSEGTVFVIHAAVLVAIVAFPLVTWLRSRSFAFTSILTVASLSLFGLVVNFLSNFIAPVTWGVLQAFLVAAMAVPAAVALFSPPPQRGPLRRQIYAVALPVALLALLFLFVTLWWTTVPAFSTPVSFLMGHSLAEDNAEWLDFAALMASGQPIEQGVPLGGPLQLFLVGIATLMAVVSQVAYGGVNEVMVAANTVIFSQFALVVLAPLALAPLAEARLPRGRGGVRPTRIPAPVILAGALILVSAVLMATAYGHLTWQFVALVLVLWATTYLVDSPIPRARLLTSIAAVAAMTVWVPLNALAGMLLVGWLAYLVVRGIRHREWDPLGLTLMVLVAVAVWEPMRSSLWFVTGSSLFASGGGIPGGVAASAPVIKTLDASLFAAGGGVEATGPLLMILAAVGAIGAAIVWDVRSRGWSAYTRLMPIGLLAFTLLVLHVLDQWATGSAPHYGANKYLFLVVIVVASATIPLALLLLSPSSKGMTAARWVGVGAVVVVLLADTLLIRSIAAARPEQWSPPIPFDNPRSYWWPADVNGTADQPVSGNPVGCVYLPAGAKAPSGLLDSQLSDPQRVYSCTRLLAGLAGEDEGAQPMVDWLRREWLTNQRAWENVYRYLSGMPDSTLDRPVILLDDGSNVIGFESMRSLLSRFPADAWSRL